MIKILTDLCFTKQKLKTKNGFVKIVYSVLVVKVCWQNKENCLSINRKQSLKLEKGTIKFENYLKQIPVPFKIYADFECNLKSVKCDDGSYTTKYQDHIPCSFAYKVVSIDDRFTKPTVVYRGKNAAFEFIKAIRQEHKYCKKIRNKRFNKIWLSVKKKNIYFDKVTVVGFIKNLLIRMRKKLEIIVT